MIRSFAGGGMQDVFNGVNSAAARKSCPQALWGIARRKLDQYRLCFRWSAQGPEDVEIVDYHAG